MNAREGKRQGKMMKKTYSKPTAEMIVFDYREQVTASGGSGSWDQGGGATGSWDGGHRGGGATGSWDDGGHSGGATGGW